MADYNALVAMAKAKRAKSRRKRWSAIEKRALVANFLNSNKSSDVVTVADQDARYIETALNTIIKADNLDELVFAVNMDGVAHLVKFGENGDAPEDEDN